MRFSATTTASVLFSLLALEAVGAPAPQYDTTIIVSTTVDVAAGSAQVSDIPVSSVQASVATSAKACKAKPPFAQAWGQHRRPRPSAPAAGGAASSQEVPSDTPSSEVPEPSIIPITSVVGTQPSPVESQMPSVVETAPVVTPTAIQAGGDGELVQSPPSQVAQPSVVEVSSAFESSYSYESSSSSSWSSSSQPAPSAGGAPAGFEADILNAHNTFRATWGAGALVWNQTLADMGNEYYKAKNCAMGHSGMAPGENLVGGSTSDGGPAQPDNGQGVLDSWAAEAVNWTIGSTVPSDDKDKVTGHFTQVVWKSTTQLGCGEFNCGSSWLAFCEYWPRGNMGGDYGDDKDGPGQVGSPQ